MYLDISLKERFYDVLYPIGIPIVILYYRVRRRGGQNFCRPTVIRRHWPRVSANLIGTLALGRGHWPRDIGQVITLGTSLVNTDNPIIPFPT